MGEVAHIAAVGEDREFGDVRLGLLGADDLDRHEAFAHAGLVFGQPHVEFRRLALEQPFQLAVGLRPHLGDRRLRGAQDDGAAHHLRAPEERLQLSGADKAAFLVRSLVDMPAEVLVAIVGGVVVALRHPGHPVPIVEIHGNDQLARLQVPQPQRLVVAAREKQIGALHGSHGVDCAGVATRKFAGKGTGLAVILDQRSVVAAGDQLLAAIDEREGSMLVAVGGVVFDPLEHRSVANDFEDGVDQIVPAAGRDCQRPGTGRVHRAAKSLRVGLRRQGLRVLEVAFLRRQAEHALQGARHFGTGVEIPAVVL